MNAAPETTTSTDYAAGTITTTTTASLDWRTTATGIEIDTENPADGNVIEITADELATMLLAWFNHGHRPQATS